MPSKSKRQLNFFKLVKAYVDSGPEGVMNMWGELFPGRKMPTAENLEKITNTADRMDYADLEDLTSGVEGEKDFGEKRDFKVGYWMKFESWFTKPMGQKRKATFIAKINRVRPDIKLVNFNSEALYNKNGMKIAPVRRPRISSPDHMWLDFAYFDQIIETAKDKRDLTMKNEIRKIVREVLEEGFNSEDLHFAGTSTLKFSETEGGKHFYDIKVNEPRRVTDSSEISGFERFPTLENVSLDDVIINKGGESYSVTLSNIRLLHDGDNPPKILHTQTDSAGKVYGQIEAEVAFVVSR